MISGVVVGTLQIDLFNDPNAVCNSGSLIGAVATQWNSATEDPPTGKTVILHQSKQRIRGLVGCCRRYRAMAPGGSRGRGISLLQGRALTTIRKNGGTFGGWAFALAQRRPLPR